MSSLRVLILTAVASLAIAVSSCSDTGPPPASLLTPYLSQVFLSPSPSGGDDILICSRFEVTRALFEADVPPGQENYPAVRMSQKEAMHWAQARGLRLPTPSEWRLLAPLGLSFSETHLAAQRNTMELGLGHTLPVGVFERSSSATESYDFFGNVWEWTYDPENASSDSALVLGGSFASWSVGDEDNQREVLVGEKADDIGFRYVADAREYFVDHFFPAWPQLLDSEKALLASSFQHWIPHLAERLFSSFSEDELPPGFQDWWRSIFPRAES